MMLTEYKSKAILTSVGIKVPTGFTVTASSEANKILSYPVAVKAQVASGGRGLAGGVLAPAQIETTLGVCAALESCADVGELARAAAG